MSRLITPSFVSPLNSPPSHDSVLEAKENVSSALRVRNDYARIGKTRMSQRGYPSEV